MSREGSGHRRRPTAGQVARHRAAAGEYVPRWELAEPPTPTPSSRRPARRRPDRSRRRSPALIAARVGAVVVTCVLIVVTGVAWLETDRLVSGFTSSGALGADTPRSSGGAENILLIGLDTRKDLDGDDLPAEVLRQLHAGDSSVGGYNTNTLILVHVPADRKNIVAFSIPRDDLVDVDGLDVSKAKIKEAYGRKKAMVTDRLMAEGVTDRKELESRGREAGRAQTIETVRNLTGVPIDRFAEVSLGGFYDLSKALGGVTVCLKHAVSDSFSGAKFRAGEQKLNARQSLAFVRQRHGLQNGDLDRTHRQQAFMLSALGQLKEAGTFTDLGKINDLVDAAQRNVVLSEGWDLVRWAQEMGTVPGQRITFSTLPVLRYGMFDGQDVNIIDPEAIRDRVQRAFGVKTGRSAASSRSSSARPTAPRSAPSDSAGTPPPDAGTTVVSGSDVPCVN
ncbi:LCP family protein [Gordonia shandongensis]|uniref:LCP family protein n=1 Tax=Gordonia shandongensis TaxID=376351 RepID=UPI0004096335|nr:LCP family protein [Gordonia shandongensis]